MKLDEWRKNQLTELTLPSGLTVTVRRVRLVDLAAQGHVPTPLVGMVNEALSGKKFDANQVDDFAEYGKLVDLVVRAVAVDPPVADVADDAHLGLDEMALSDKSFIFRWAHEEAERLGGFRAEPAGDVAGGGDGGRVRGEAEPVAASPG